MIKTLDVISALAFKLKKIHPERRVFFNDVSHFTEDSTSVELITAKSSVSSDGKIERHLSLDIVCFFKEPSTEKAVELEDDMTVGIGTGFVVNDRFLTIGYVSESNILDDMFHYMITITYTDSLDVIEPTADALLLDKIEKNTGIRPVFELMAGYEFKLEER